MPAIDPIPPALLKRVLELAEYKVITEDKHNWLLAKFDHDVPIILPKRGQLVAVDVMMNTLASANLPPGAYFPLRDKALAEAARQL